MLIRTVLCFFAAAISCGVHGLETGNIYKYDYKECYHVANGSDISFGHFKADLFIRPLSNDKWSVYILNPLERYTVDANETENCGTFPSDAPDFTNGTHSDEPFEISWKNGVITALDVELNTQEEDLVRIKGISSHLQLDLQGTNCNESTPCQLPTETGPDAAYETAENTTAGVCATQYDVSRYLESPQTEGDEKEPLFKVVKTSDLLKCSRCSEGILDNLPRKKKDKLVSWNSTNHVVFSGNMSEYVIQSTYSTLKAIALPPQQGLPGPTMVWVTNLTLASTYPAEGLPWNVSSPQKANLETWC